MLLSGASQRSPDKGELPLQDSMNEAEHGTRADLHWVGGWRTALTDEKCETSANPSWPYFTVQAGGEATDYNGCGTDPVHDWVWRKWIEEDKMIEVPFSSNPGASSPESMGCSMGQFAPMVSCA